MRSKLCIYLSGALAACALATGCLRWDVLTVLLFAGNSLACLILAMVVTDNERMTARLIFHADHAVAQARRIDYLRQQLAQAEGRLEGRSDAIGPVAMELESTLPETEPEAAPAYAFAQP